MLSRWEELQNEYADNHGRFPFDKCVAYRYDFLDIPIVDEYQLIYESK